MATMNPFDLLGDDDNEDPSQLIAAQQKLAAPAPKKVPAPAQSAQPAKPAKLPTKPLPPAQAVREARNDGGRGAGRGAGRGYGRGRGGGFNRDLADNENFSHSNHGASGGYRSTEDGDAGRSSERRGYGGPRGGSRGGRRGGFSNGEPPEGERPRRMHDRRSGTGHGNEIKREGAGRGNWGTPTDEVVPEADEPTNEPEKIVEADKPLEEDDAGDANKENPASEPEQKEPEDKEMTLEEYEKILEEKRKALVALKTKERKVVVDKDFESMQVLSSKKSDEDVFVKLGSDKDKRKDAAEKEERAKKSVSINEFLKPAGGEGYYGRGRGRGRHGRSPRGGYSGSNSADNVVAPSIEDDGQFPSLGGK